MTAISMSQENNFRNSHAPLNGSNDIVITGISGRLSDLPEELIRFQSSNGKLKETDRFDSTSDNVNSMQAHNMSSLLQLLFEVIYESICDAGVNPAKIKGTQTGVFLATSGFDEPTVYGKSSHRLDGHDLTDYVPSMFANRLSYAFDFRGPAWTTDTPFLSILSALQCALNALQSGACDAAIVGGVDLCFQPKTSLQFPKLEMLSNDRVCTNYDASSVGCVRSETVVTIFLQKRCDAKRLYSTVLHCDSNKDDTLLSSCSMQQRLLQLVSDGKGFDSNRIGYVDTCRAKISEDNLQEMNAMTKAFCGAQSKSSPVGSTKFDMNQAKTFSEVETLVKLIVTIQNGYLPANRYFNSSHINTPELIGTCSKYDIEKITSFTCNSVNVPADLEVSKKQTFDQDSSRSGPRLALVCAQTADGCKEMLKVLKDHETNIEFQALLTENALHSPETHPFRGFTLLNSKRSLMTVQKCNIKRRPLWYVFSGMGCQWFGMGRELMTVKFFRESIERSTTILRKYDIDLYQLLLSNSTNDWDKLLTSFVTIVAIQIALVDCLKNLNVEPDGIVGYSIGELACAYADKCFTAEQTLQVAYVCGECIQKANLPEGGMAAVGLTLAECNQLCPPDIAVACHNAKDIVSVSGPKASIEHFIEELKKKKIFAKDVASNGIAFHSYHMLEIAPKLKDCLKRVISNPLARRSIRWVSSSVPENAWNTSSSQYSSADYFVNNLCSPVLFQAALQHVPSNAILLELAPHCILLPIIKRSSNTNCTHLSLMKRNEQDHIAYFNTNLGKLYNEGINLNIMNNYELIKYPVSSINVPCISPLITSQWDHSQQQQQQQQQQRNSKYDICTPVFRTIQQAKYVIDLGINGEYAFIAGHQINGRCLFPATGYLVLVWKTFARLHGFKTYRQMSVVFKSVQFHRPMISLVSKKLTLLVNLLPENNSFEVVENNTVIVTGRVYRSEELILSTFYQHHQVEVNATKNENVKNLTSSVIYRNLSLHGYEYSGTFRGIEKMRPDGRCGQLKWQNEWISFLDAMVQAHLIHAERLQLLTRIDFLRIDPQLHSSLVSSNCSVYVDRWNGFCLAGAIEFVGLDFMNITEEHKQQCLTRESDLFTSFGEEESQPNISTLQACLHFILEKMPTQTLLIHEYAYDQEDVSKQIFDFFNRQTLIDSIDYLLISNNEQSPLLKTTIKVLDSLPDKSPSADLIIVHQDETVNWTEIVQNCKPNGFVLFFTDKYTVLPNSNLILLNSRQNIIVFQKLSDVIHGRENIQLGSSKPHYFPAAVENSLFNVKLVSSNSIENRQLLTKTYSTSLVNSKENQQLTVKSSGGIDTSLSSATLTQLLPKELLVSLNNRPTSSKYQRLFIIHPIEGHVDMLRELAGHLSIAVYGFQSTDEVPNESIEDMAAFYIQKILQLQPTGPYLIAGYSFGACVALEIALQLPAVAELLLLNGSQTYFTIHAKQYRTNFNELENAEVTMLYAFMQQLVPALDRTKTLFNLTNLSSYDDRLKYAVNYLDQTLHLGTEQLILAAHRYRSKLLAADKYTPSSKIQCATTLFRIQSNNDFSETIPQDYNLSTVCQGLLDIIIIPGDDQTFTQGGNAKALAAEISTNVLI